MRVKSIKQINSRIHRYHREKKDDITLQVKIACMRATSYILHDRETIFPNHQFVDYKIGFPRPGTSIGLILIHGSSFWKITEFC